MTANLSSPHENSEEEYNRVTNTRRKKMQNFKNNLGGAALIFPEESEVLSIMCVSAPPPLWLDSHDLSKIVISESGIYCIYFLLSANDGDFACLTINGERIESSRRDCHGGEIFGSAVCSIREAALPCTLGITRCDGSHGIFFVARCRI